MQADAAPSDEEEPPLGLMDEDSEDSEEEEVAAPEVRLHHCLLPRCMSEHVHASGHIRTVHHADT
jgi:hypothetical protein